MCHLLYILAPFIACVFISIPQIELWSVYPIQAVSASSPLELLPGSLRSFKFVLKSDFVHIYLKAND